MAKTANRGSAALRAVCAALLAACVCAPAGVCAEEAAGSDAAAAAEDVAAEDAEDAAEDAATDEEDADAAEDANAAEDADADAATDEEDALVIELSAPESVDVARVDAVALPVSATPGYIEVGIDCGMVEMCGIDPCLCGAVDAYGACACNGTEWVAVSFEVQPVEEGSAAVLQLFGATYIVPLTSGEIELSVTATLPHYEDAVATVTLDVAGWTALDAGKVLAALLAAVVVVLGVVALVRGVVRGLRAAVRTLVRRVRRGRGRADAEEKVPPEDGECVDAAPAEDVAAESAAPVDAAPAEDVAAESAVPADVAPVAESAPAVESAPAPDAPAPAVAESAPAVAEADEGEVRR